MHRYRVFIAFRLKGVLSLLCDPCSVTIWAKIKTRAVVCYVKGYLGLRCFLCVITLRESRL